MMITDLIMLTAEDIRHARAIDLEQLTGIHASNFAAWTNSRNISEKNLEVIATGLGISKMEVFEGLELRRKDFAIAREVQAKFERIISARGAA